MDWTNLIAVLAFFTLLAGALAAFVSKQQVDKRKHDPSSPKSTLAKDESSHAAPADVSR